MIQNLRQLRTGEEERERERGRGKKEEERDIDISTLDYLQSHNSILNTLTGVGGV